MKPKIATTAASPIEDEFTAICSYYYQLTLLHAKREAYLNILLANAPLYAGQTNLSEIDAIITYYRNTQAAKAKMDETFYELKDTERNILLIMQHFEIPPGTILTGTIPGELEYELYINENDTIYISKSKDLAPLEDEVGIITIKFWDANDGEED